MAVSLAFGLMVATFLVLFLVPVFYKLYGRSVGLDDQPSDDHLLEEYVAPKPVQVEPSDRESEPVPTLTRQLGMEGQQ